MLAILTRESEALTPSGGKELTTCAPSKSLAARRASAVARWQCQAALRHPGHHCAVQPAGACRPAQGPAQGRPAWECRKVGTFFGRPKASKKQTLCAFNGLKAAQPK